ncbi:DNA methyltransferase [Thioalkalivibrio sp. ALE19]|uniref:class I SAM-dependent DNA methyltransferase n=1 Tax=Thioalkalivibrio sp. ALE19 TaxID=1266909 RepID=UPI00040F3ADB|nr:DNA methyltransferase [Thioalkalivibrio sp. ALE19]
MAINQAKIMEGLEEAVTGPDEEFIYRFLDLYGFPKATLTQLRNGTGNRNVATEPGAVALKKKVYFLPVPRGEDVHAAHEALLRSGRLEQHGIRFTLVTDFQSVAGYDLHLDDSLDEAYTNLHRNYGFYLPLAGVERVRMHTEAVADEKAADRMGRLCDMLRDRNPTETEEDIHRLNVFMARVLFCLFAEDTGIFRQHQFTETFLSHTQEDASDAHVFLREFFRVLNRPPEERGDDVPAHLDAFPYVNGGLFREDLPVPEMGARARRLIRDAGKLDWSAINPDIFGSMFQAVIDPAQRGSLGQHYTSVSNIMKVLRPLFLDDLYAELAKAKGNRKRLNRLLERIHSLKVFDPACGSGAFLIIAYKELRRLEMAIFEAMDGLNGKGAGEPLVPDVQSEMFDRPGQQPLMPQQGQGEIFMSGIRLEQFYGIEIDDFAHEIALLSLWLAEHQMHAEFEAKFGHAEPMLPLKSSGNIVLANALRVNWRKVCDPSDAEVVVMGNPPFLGANGRSDSQNEDMAKVFSGFRTYKYLDLVASWFWKAAQYLQGTTNHAAFVSTNSICQGIQVDMLWPPILDLGVEIEFAYQTFPWSNQAKGNAGVHVIIVGLSADPGPKRLFQRVDGEWRVSEARNISPYLVEGGDTVVRGRSKPFRNAAPLVYGNKPTDGGHLLLSPPEKEELVRKEPEAARWIRRLMGAEEFLNGKERWCLWLKDAANEEINAMPLIRDRVEKVRETRLSSPDPGARALADRPHQFRDLNFPGQYIIVPRVTSERREYAPVGFLDNSVIATDAVNIIPGATFYEFGILSSRMHMDWLRLVGGRLKSDYRYSAKLVYNTFPWPEHTPAQRAEIERLAEQVLLTREETYELPLAEMYDPDKMPDGLRRAHRELDEAVERLFRDRPFRDMAEREEYLLARYAELVEEEQRKGGR